MSTYIVGDIQGCLTPLHRLLHQVRFDPARDQLWSVGDVVNRGPDSLETLRYLRSLGCSFRMVLGNHDLHLLAVAYGKRQPKRGDTLDGILNAPDRDELILWLRQQPLLFREKDCVVVHAGIPHIWTIDTALALSREVESALQDDQQIVLFLDGMYGNTPARWDAALSGMDRLRTITNYLTRMRICQADGTLDLAFKSSPDEIPANHRAWFDWHAESTNETGDHIYFGHWAALPCQTYHTRYHALDSGCIWGGQLSLFHMEKSVRIHCQCG